MTTFHRARIGTTTVASAYTAGSGSLVVTDGSQLGAGMPFLVIISRAGVRMSVLEVTAKATNTLTISGAKDGTTDVNLLVGDLVREGPCALHVNELQDAVNTLPAYDQLSNLTAAEVAITGTTALTSAAFGRLHVCSGTSANYTVTLPAPAGNAGRWIGVRMASTLTKFVTIAQNASETINGAASRLMWANEAATLLCDGTNWFKIAGRSIAMQASARLTGSPDYQAQAIANATLTQVLLNQVDLDNTGSMADLSNHQIIIRRAGTYNAHGIIPYASFTAAATRVWSATNPDGGVQEVSTVAGAFPVVGFPSNFVVPAGYACTVNTYQTSGATQYLYGNTTTTAAQLKIVEINPW